MLFGVYLQIIIGSVPGVVFILTIKSGRLSGGSVEGYKHIEKINKKNCVCVVLTFHGSWYKRLMGQKKTNQVFRNRRMSPKYVNKKQRTADIVTAAIEVFSQKGYGATSVDQIAAAAGLSKGTLYEYFPSKESLYIAAIMEFVKAFEDDLQRRLASSDDPFVRLVSYIGYWLDFCAQEDAASVQLLFDILQQSVLDEGVFKKRKYLIKEMMVGVRKIMTDILLEGVSRGIFHPAIAKEAEVMATNMLAYLDGASLHYTITENYFKPTEQITYWVKLTANHILITPDAYDVDELIAQIIGR